ncbi:MAG: hypothetical protein R3C97_01810 [Geminicoccaceae bacterium]
MHPIDSDLLLQIPDGLIAEANGMTVTLPAGDYRAERVATLGGDGAHDQYLLIPLGQMQRAHAVSGATLQALIEDRRVRTMAEG